MKNWKYERKKCGKMIIHDIKSKGHNLVNKSTANGTKYTRQIFKEAMILTFD
jgi:hypothetical protein